MEQADDTSDAVDSTPGWEEEQWRERIGESSAALEDCVDSLRTAMRNVVPAKHQTQQRILWSKMSLEIQTDPAVMAALRELLLEELPRYQTVIEQARQWGKDQRPEADWFGSGNAITESMENCKLMYAVSIISATSVRDPNHAILGMSKGELLQEGCRARRRRNARLFSRADEAEQNAYSLIQAQLRERGLVDRQVTTSVIEEVITHTEIASALTELLKIHKPLLRRAREEAYGWTRSMQDTSEADTLYTASIVVPCGLQSTSFVVSDRATMEGKRSDGRLTRTTHVLGPRTGPCRAIPSDRSEAVCAHRHAEIQTRTLRLEPYLESLMRALSASAASKALMDTGDSS